MKTYSVELTAAQIELIQIALTASHGEIIDKIDHLREQRNTLARAPAIIAPHKRLKGYSMRGDPQVLLADALARLKDGSPAIVAAARAVELYRNKKGSTVGWDRFMKKKYPDAAALLWPNWGKSR